MLLFNNGVPYPPSILTFSQHSRSSAAVLLKNRPHNPDGSRIQQTLLNTVPCKHYVNDPALPFPVSAYMAEAYIDSPNVFIDDSVYGIADDECVIRDTAYA